MNKNIYQNLDAMVLHSIFYFVLCFSGGIPEEFQVEDAF